MVCLGGQYAPSSLPKHLIQAVQSVYDNGTMVVIIHDSHSDRTVTNQRLQQGYILLSTLDDLLRN